MKQKILDFIKKNNRAIIMSSFAILFATIFLYMSAFASAFINDSSFLSLPSLLNNEAKSNSYGKVSLRVETKNSSTLQKIKNDLSSWNERNNYGSAYFVYEYFEKNSEFSLSFGQQDEVSPLFVDSFSIAERAYFNNLNVQSATDNGWDNLKVKGNVYISSSLAKRLYAFYGLDSELGYSSLIGKTLPNLNDFEGEALVIGGVFNSNNLQAQYYSLLLPKEIIFASEETLADFTPSYLGVDFGRNEKHNTDLLIHLDYLQKKYNFSYDFINYKNINSECEIETRRLVQANFYKSNTRIVYILIIILVALVFFFEFAFSLYNVFNLNLPEKTTLILCFLLPAISFIISFLGIYLTGWLLLKPNLPIFLSAPINLNVNLILLVVMFLVSLFIMYSVSVAKKNNEKRVSNNENVM